MVYTVIRLYFIIRFDLSWSPDVVGHVTIWKPTCRFLLVVLRNGDSKSSRFRDIAL